MTGTADSGLQFYIEATPTVDTAAFATGDLIGAAAIELSGATGGNEIHGGMIQSVIVTDLAKQSAALDIVFFDADPSNTTFTENAAFDPDDADILNIIGVAAITDWKAFNDSSVGQALNLAIPFVADTKNKLYAVIVSRGAPTYGASDVTLRVGVLAG